MKPPSGSGSLFSIFASVGIVVLSLALCGSTELWAQATVTSLLAVLLIVAPPRYSPGKWPVLIAFALLSLALAAFLPANWFPIPEWRQQLVETFHVPLGTTRTPQPWLTAQACCLFFVGLVWALYALGQNWSEEARSRVARFLVVGVAILAALAVFGFTTGYEFPFWPQLKEFRGWFPNKNQTADVLALCGVLNYALAFEGLRKDVRAGCWWLVSFAPICAGLVVAYSRAGIILFFGGIILWHLLSLRRGGGSAKWIALATSAAAILLMLFLLFGGETIERFRINPVGEKVGERDFRIVVQKDALRFSTNAPWLGIGLGNFEYLFARERNASVQQNRTIHPESDWLWAASEMGWISPLLLLAAVGWWFRQSVAFYPKGSEFVSVAAASGVLLFALHGLVDVSGHRLGSAFVALFLAGMALPIRENEAFQRFIPWVFRGLGVVLAIIATWWFASLYGAKVPPTTVTLERLQQDVKKLAARNELSTVPEIATRALEIAPLDWPLYFDRASAEVWRSGSLTGAVNDFHTARFLEPHWVNLPMDEGTVWMAADQPELCLEAWQDALKRDPSSASTHFAEMLSLSGPATRNGLRELAQTEVNYLLIFLETATPGEARTEIANFLVTDPDLKTLSTEQRRALFSVWWTRGDKESLAAKLLAHEEWQQAGWSYLAAYYAGENDFERACEIMLRFAPAPAIPDFGRQQSLADLQRDFYTRPDDVARGLALCMNQIKQQQRDDALLTIRALKKIKDRPGYVSYLEAQLLTEKKEWKEAWGAWSEFSTRRL